VSLNSKLGARRSSSVIRSGFTLIEILVVLAIIGTLAMVVGPSVFRNVGDANVVAARTQIETFSVALETWRLDMRSYPSTEEGLAVLVVRPLRTPERWRGPYLRKQVPLDPWGRPYQYISPGIANSETFDLYSLGRDGAPGGTGEDADITSWGGEVAR
jgi:general secretion pathway protein G